MNYKSLKGKLVWITGASSGIGREMAFIAAEAGSSLLLLSSRKEALAETGKICIQKGAESMQYASINLSQTAETASSVGKLLADHGTPEYLILNAGISQRSLLGETDFSVIEEIMAVNFLGTAAIARIVLPEMVKAGGGHIGVTSSLVGRFGFPMRSAYSASKHALHGFFESLALEYHSKSIHVTLVLPGRIRTMISHNSLDGQGQRHAVLDRGQEKGMDPHLCAEKYWRSVLKRRYNVVIGGREKVMLFLHDCVPWLFRVIARRVNPL